LHRVKGLIEAYNAEREKYLHRLPEDTDIHVLRQYESGDNLLSFLPVQVFYGQRPSVWWTRRHDIDLLFGTN
jgi:hypothetical protein